MSRLLSRQTQIPGGFRFYQPETKWDSSKAVGAFPSFQRLVDAIIQHRNGNPGLCQQKGWRTDQDGVSAEVDHYNASLCQHMGWMKYIAQGGGPEVVPKSLPLPPIDPKQISAVAERVKKIWAGVKTLNDWIDSGEPPVAQEQANKRAEICSTCVNNGAGDFTKWFTAPAAESIRRQMERVADRQLSTPFDDKINVCEACLCPLKLKVQTPMKYIGPHITEATKQDLAKNPNCWILAELHEQ